MPDSYCRRAIITGASSGLGEEFALQLAPYVEEMILVARRSDRLKIVDESARKAHPGLKVTIVAADLTDAASLLDFIDRMLALPPAKTLLVNNAGMGDYGEFATADWERVEQMLVLNILTLTKICHSLLPGLIRDGGGIINISSLASSLPIPDFAVYAASKSYVLSLSEALRLELKDKGINVLAVCPGPVPTEFGDVARREGFTGDMMPGKSFFYTDKETVVSESIRAMMNDKPRIYPGTVTRLSALFLSLIPAFVLRMVLSLRFRRSVPLDSHSPSDDNA